MERLIDLLLAGEETSDRYYQLVSEVEPAEWPELLALADHPEATVRRALVGTLPSLTDPPPDDWVELAILLSTDPAATVRDWACFVLGQQWQDIDTPALRQALADRLDDIDRNTRCEALFGLAYRHDERALPRVRAALGRPSGDLWFLEFTAAGALSDPSLYPLVLDHLDGWEDDKALEVDAVRRLVHPNGPGQDLLAGMAGLYRARAHQQPEPPEGLHAWRVMSTMLDLAPTRGAEFLESVADLLDDDAAARDELLNNSTLAYMLSEVDEP